MVDDFADFTSFQDSSAPPSVAPTMQPQQATVQQDTFDPFAALSPPVVPQQPQSNVDLFSADFTSQPASIPQSTPQTSVFDAFPHSFSMALQQTTPSNNMMTSPMMSNMMTSQPPQMNLMQPMNATARKLTEYILLQSIALLFITWVWLVV